MAKLQALEDLYQEKVNFKELLFRRIRECSIKLERASKLTDLLADEKQRWSEEIERLKIEEKYVLGNSIFASGFLAYSGAFNIEYRKRIEQEFLGVLERREIPYKPGVSFAGFLGSPLEIMNWSIHGLPKDETSVQNGIILKYSQRWPLMIDPQNRALKFLRNFGREFKIKSVKATGNFMPVIEQEVQTGGWVLIESVGEELDPALDSILAPKIQIINGTKEITLGEKVLQYDDRFRLFLTTTLPNPTYSPETSAKVTIINFGVTLKGLEELLLAQTMANENLQLENKKLEIIQQNSSDKKRLKEIEDNILLSLKNSSGDILMDESLIFKLQESKETSRQIKGQMEVSAKTEELIDQTRESYREVSYYCSLLFFTIIQLIEIDTMYQFSLQWFTGLYQCSLENSEKSENINQRVELIKGYFNEFLYRSVCRSLFESHKLIFSFLMCINIQKGFDQLEADKLQLFLIGGRKSVEAPANSSDFISDQNWQIIYQELHGVSESLGNPLILDDFS